MRNRIYELVYRRSIVIEIFPPDTFERGESTEKTHVLGLLHTCIQTRHEARPLFFSHCTFDLRPFDMMDYRKYHFKLKLDWPQQEIQLVKIGDTSLGIIKAWFTDTSVVPEESKTAGGDHWLCGFRKLRLVTIGELPRTREPARYRPEDPEWCRESAEAVRRLFCCQELEVQFDS